MTDPRADSCLDKKVRCVYHEVRRLCGVDLMIAIQCPCGCGNTIHMPDALRGRLVACPATGKSFVAGIRTQLCDEEAWMQGVHPAAMLRYISHYASPRKLRLATVAFCRLLGEPINGPATQKALAAVEAFADGHASIDDVQHAIRQAGEQLERLSSYHWETSLAQTMVRLLRMGDAREMASTAFFYVTQMLRPTREEARHAAADVLQELFGNPFQPLVVAPVWRHWSDQTVVRIAQSVYNERHYDDLPILADALEESGCDSAELLTHLRQTEPHQHGCWALDLVLGLK